MNELLSIIGLGYVGLPLTLALAKRFDSVIGMDIDEKRVQELNSGFDRTKEADEESLLNTTAVFTTNMSDLSSSTFIIVTVPTPIDKEKRPDLSPVCSATRAIGKILKPGMVIVYESTVYPGVTEEICGPILEEMSGLKCGVDFHLGYSPERINPGDKIHTLEKIVKVVAGQDSKTTERVAKVYSEIIEAGIHVAPSIRVAEAAKVIENTQRDLNIALMNELAIIFDKMEINTIDVLEAAGTKWNFLPFRPGLVGGHCIGVDPYYLTSKAESLGLNPEVILAGRKTNDEMGSWIARKTLKLLNKTGKQIQNAKIGILGLTFKEDVPDLRNSRVPDIIEELQEFGAEVLVFDPHANKEEASHEYNITLSTIEQITEMDAIIVAVSHKEFFDQKKIISCFKSGGVLVDVKSIYKGVSFPEDIHYWAL